MAKMQTLPQPPGVFNFHHPYLLLLLSERERTILTVALDMSEFHDKENVQTKQHLMQVLHGAA